MNLTKLILTLGLWTVIIIAVPILFIASLIGY